MNFKRESNHTLLCIARQADSMAFHIFQFCNHRYILQNSKMMQHQMSIHNLSGNIEQLMHYIQVSYKMYENLILQGSQRIGLSTAEYKKKINDDWYLYGEDIINNRVADVEEETEETETVTSTQAQQINQATQVTRIGY